MCFASFGMHLTLASTQLAVITVHTVRRPGEDPGEGRLADSAGSEEHHTIGASRVGVIPRGVGGDDRVGGRPAAAAAVRLAGGARARLGAGDAGGDAGQEAVGEQVAARVADAPAVQLALQAQAVPPHAGQHGARKTG